MEDLGIASFNLAAIDGHTVENGNTYGLVSSYTTGDGKAHDLTDVWFRQEAQLTLAENAPGVTTLRLVSEGQDLDLTTVDTTRLQGVDVIDLTGAGSNALTLTAKDVLDMAGMNTCNSATGWTGLSDSVKRHQLVVDGSSGDSVISAGWTDTHATATNNGHTYEVYNASNSLVMAQLLVDSAVVRTGITA